MKQAENGQGILFEEVRKMRKRFKTVGLGLVAAGLSITLLLTGAIPAQAENTKMVKIGLEAAWTGPLATTAKAAMEGLIDGVNDANERGFLPAGIKAEVIWEETRGEIPKAITAYKRLKERGMVIKWTLLGTYAELTLPLHQRDEIPEFSFSSLTRGMISQPERWAFGAMMGSPSEFLLFTKWVRENWTEECPPRIGLIFYNHATGWVLLDATKLADEMGFEYVGYEVVPMTVIDTSTEWLRMADRKVDWVYVGACAMPLVVLMKDAQRLELQQKGIKLCTYAPGIDEDVINAVRADANGWYVMSLISLYDIHPGVAVTREIEKKHRGYVGRDVSWHHWAGILEARTGIEAIRLAIEKVGYENLNGRAVRDALVSIRDFDGYGFLPYKTSMTEGKPYLADSMCVCQVRDEKIIRVSEYYRIDKSIEYVELGGRV